ncbi:MAG: GNAT family protein [Alphaproteobacteria bacterium]|nr:GNAT family protein [Alphaproteobacteria bacterium]
MDFIASLFRLPPKRPQPPLDTQLIGARVTLRMAESEDWRAWHALRDLSRDHLTPWEPEWPPHALSYGFYCSLLRRHWREWQSGKAYAFVILLHDAPRPVFVGGITLSDVQFANAQKGTIGYWIGKPYAGQGLMTEAVGLISDFAFNHLGLQRLEASCMPKNEASKTVLLRAGFEQEGYAKAYLQINGKREDHLLWGRNTPTA